jgi:hypothetical protein
LTWRADTTQHDTNNLSANRVVSWMCLV